MKKLNPYLYWFSFEDSVLSNLDDHSDMDVHFYQTIILSVSEVEALYWGDKLANQLVETGEAKKICSSWIEVVIPFLLTPQGNKEIGWENIVDLFFILTFPF